MELATVRVNLVSQPEGQVPDTRLCVESCEDTCVESWMESCRHQRVMHGVRCIHETYKHERVMIGVMESCGVIPDEITPQKGSHGDFFHSCVRVMSILLHYTKPRIRQLPLAVMFITM